MCIRGGVYSRLSLSQLVWFVFFAAIASPCADHPSQSNTKQPVVTSVTQITRDGVSKTNLLADDSNLYVTEWPSARHVIKKVKLPGGDPSAIPNTPPNAQAIDLSADLSKLLISQFQGGESEFWALPVAAGTAQRLGDITGRDASWSRDGKHLVFGKGTKLYIADANGSSPREMFTAEGTIFGTRFSPDGKRIRFTVGNTAQNATWIWEVGADGANPHSVLANWKGAGTACCGTWTRDGRYYIFQVTQTSPTTITTLWALADSDPMNMPVQLTSGPMSFGNASLARDNKKLWAIGVQPAGEAVKYDAASRAFVPLPASISGTDVDYSSDGKWVTYISVPDATLWRCRADGGDRLQLTKAPERAALPHWSPDGKRIAYVSMHPGELTKIALIGVDGGAAVDMLKEPRAQIDANWSSDGNRIMFGYLYDVEGKDFRIIDLRTGKVETVPGSQELFSPRWSPDGRYVAALSPDFTKVMLYDFKLNKWKMWLNEPAGAVSYPVWSSDSKYLYFDDQVTDEESIRRVKVGESKPETVFKLEGIERYPGQFGLWSSRTNDGSYMFVRDRSTQEVYQLAVELP